MAKTPSVALKPRDSLVHWSVSVPTSNRYQFGNMQRLEEMESCRMSEESANSPNALARSLESSTKIADSSTNFGDNLTNFADSSTSVVDNLTNFADSSTSVVDNHTNFASSSTNFANSPTNSVRTFSLAVPTDYATVKQWNRFDEIPYYNFR